MYEAKLNYIWTMWIWKLPAALLAAVLVAGSIPAFGTDGGRRCAEAIALSPDGRHQGLTGEATCYRIEVPGPGFLVVAVETLVELSDDTPPRLRLHGQDKAAEVVGRGASHLTLWIGASVDAVLVEVGPLKRRDVLGEHSLIRRFLAETDLIVMAGTRTLSTKEGQEGEIDPILVTSNSTVDPFDLRTLRPGMYTMIVEDRYSLIFSSLSW